MKALDQELEEAEGELVQAHQAHGQCLAVLVELQDSRVRHLEQLYDARIRVCFCQ